jgi:hypothetical protein
MFIETVTINGDTLGKGSVAEECARRMLRDAPGQGIRAEATKTGGVVFTWEAPSRTPASGLQVSTLEPQAPIGRLTPTVREDLEALDLYPAERVDEAEAGFRANVGRISAGVYSVPRGTSARLVERGLLVPAGESYSTTSNGHLPETRTPFRLSLAARLALHAHAHLTTTGAPRGYYRPGGEVASAGLNKPGGRAGMLHDSTSWAKCSCGSWSQFADTREEARRLARAHREEATAQAVTAVLR